MQESVPLANALRDLAWIVPRTLGRAPSPARLLPRSELEVMRLLAQHPGLSVNDVAAELELQPPNVSAAVRSLVARGQLERVPDPEDGRIVRLQPTPLAMAIRAAQEQAWAGALDTVLEQLSEDERDALHEAAGALAALARGLTGHSPSAD